jgi:hypothetical protein
MSHRCQTLLTALCFALSLLLQAGAAGACARGGAADAAPHPAHADSMPAHAAMMAMATAQPPAHGMSPQGDCCNDSKHCPMQACFTGAALPCQAQDLQLPSQAMFPSPAPEPDLTPAHSRFVRPPIFA